MPQAFRFTFSMFGEEQINRTLLRFADNVHDATPVWEKLAAKFATLEKRQFNSEGQSGSGGWVPLSPTYAAWKRRHFPGRRILERTGDLRKSLTERPFAVEQIEPGFMVLGSDVAYGAFHQRGGDHLPRRRPVELTAYQRTDWIKTIQRFIVTGDPG